MPATTFTLEQQNAREQVLSTDINRLGKLASREAQNLLLNASRRDDFTDTAGAPLRGVTGGIVERADVLGTIAGSAGSYNVNVGAGQAFMDITAPDVDSSDYSVVRWDNTVITSIAPDAGTFRVDLIVATPAMVTADLQSRNILVDPVLRTVTPANVYKTSNPLATLSVVTGTPGDSSAPAVPGGSVALWEVISYNTDADSTTYRFIPRIWRRVESFSSCHAILENCVPADGGVHLESVSDPPALAYGKVHRAIIDGEVICAPLVAAFSVPATPDTNNNPVTAGIDAAKDVFCYLYLCGGRHAPQNGVGVADTPLRLVASLTAPSGGRASAALAISGVTVAKAGTLYCGVWFIASATHNYKSCKIVGDWVYAQSRAGGPLGPAFMEAPATGAHGDVTIHPPVTSTLANLILQAADVTPANVQFFSGLYAALDVDFMLANLYTGLAATIPFSIRVSGIAVGGGHFCWSGGTTTPTSVYVCATGYNMNVPRIG